MDPAVSIIVPVKDGGKYVERCYEFIKAQTFKDFELIFVLSKGNSDNTAEVLHNLAEQEKSFTIIAQVYETGLGENRNTGVRYAHADLIWFCDVDDAPSEDFLKDMVDIQRTYDADMVCCNFINTNPDGRIEPSSKKPYYSLKVMDRDEAVASRLREEFPVASWCKLFKRSILEKEDARFLDMFKAEDIVHTFACLLECEKICIYDRPLYAYRQNPGSICSSDPDARAHDEIEAYGYVNDLYRNTKYSKEVSAHCRLMKMRSSGHMTKEVFMENYRNGGLENVSGDLAKTWEGRFYRYFPSLYYTAITFFVKNIYKRDGSMGMRKNIGGEKYYPK